MVAQAEAGTERHRVGQQAQRVPRRTYLDRQQLACGRRVGVDLVDDRQTAGKPVGHQHSLVARHQDGADGRAVRQQGPQPGSRLVVAQARRHYGHGRTRRSGCRRGERQGRPHASAGPAGGGHARGEHAQPAGRRGGAGYGYHRGVHGAERRDPGLADRAADLAFQPADQRGRAAHRALRTLAAPGRHPSRADDLAAGHQHDLGRGVADVDPGDHRHAAGP